MESKMKTEFQPGDIVQCVSTRKVKGQAERWAKSLKLGHLYAVGNYINYQSEWEGGVSFDLYDANFIQSALIFKKVELD